VLKCGFLVSLGNPINIIPEPLQFPKKVGILKEKEVKE